MTARLLVLFGSASYLKCTTEETFIVVRKQYSKGRNYVKEHIYIYKITGGRGLGEIENAADQ
jgi:hypothetical protein